MNFMNQNGDNIPGFKLPKLKPGMYKRIGVGVAAAAVLLYIGATSFLYCAGAGTCGYSDLRQVYE
ncbi:hypothetical protein ACFSQ7_15365 [Paenibacillus rhizoplanae]